MCTAPNIPVVETPPPAPAPPPVLEQVAPKSAGRTNDTDRKRTGLSRYKLDASGDGSDQPTRTTNLGGIPKGKGVAR